MIWTRALAGPAGRLVSCNCSSPRPSACSRFGATLKVFTSTSRTEFGAPLAQDQIVVAPAGGFDMIDDQITIRPQFRIGQRVGDAADGLVGGRPDQGRIRVEHDVETDLRQFRQLRRDRRPLLRLGIHPRLDAFGRLLAQGGQVDVHFLVGRELLDDISGRDRLRARRRCRPGQHGQGTEQQADVLHPPLHRTHQLYPAAVIALLQFGVAFLVDSSRHCRPLTGSVRTSRQNLFSSQLQSLTSEVRAVMRCWMALKAVG